MKPEAEQRAARRDEAGQGKVGCSGTSPWEGSSLPTIPIEGSRAPSPFTSVSLRLGRQSHTTHSWNIKGLLGTVGNCGKGWGRRSGPCGWGWGTGFH